MKLISNVIKSLVRVIFTLSIPLLLVISVGFLGIAMIYILPVTYLQTDGVLAFFTTGDDDWDLERDRKLGETYKELAIRNLGSKEQQMYTPSQYEQAESFALDWTVLAAVDRILGDPTMNDKINRNPQPEKHYKAIKPNFIWKPYNVIVKEKIETEDGSTYWETIEYKVQLLIKVTSYNQHHELNYRKETVTSPTKIIEKWVLDEVETQTLDKNENRLIKLLESYKLPQKDIEMVEELALVYSESPNHQETQNLFDQIKNGNKEERKGPQAWTGTLPLVGIMGKDFVQTSYFGYRTDPFTGKTAYHDGADLAAPAGTPVYAPIKGIVVYASTMRGFGNTIMIEHGGYLTLYGHLSAIHVRKSQQVEVGDLIGRVGSTGRSTGPHLHWSLYENSFGKKNARDPMTYKPRK
ncbi:M23 family metallopeptidase [Brevibacillus laterosporus]|uniref:M23 family metallopeptidase n=1 Tax=Brevibacillus laterosporus TaxID=1465 RepID=UPI001F08D91F|nr:M23 family metallopeptidase [Brevibacillus laterosporus]